MKVSQEEIDAAIVAYNGSILTVVGRKQLNGMTAALTAALTVRKARKLAKRERQRKEKDSAIQTSVADIMTWCGKTIPEMTTGELVAARDELANNGFKSMRENGFFQRLKSEIIGRKEKDKQVQESAGPVGVLLGIDPFWVKTAPVGDEHIISSKFPPSKALIPRRKA